MDRLLLESLKDGEFFLPGEAGMGESPLSLRTGESPLSLRTGERPLLLTTGE